MLEKEADFNVVAFFDDVAFGPEKLVELKEQYTIIIVTHNMQQAARIADYTSFFIFGELIEHGMSSKIFTNPKNKKTEDYVMGKFG